MDKNHTREKFIKQVIWDHMVINVSREIDVQECPGV
jgi:hypothetical protein